jgi:uncharacterized membrane protein
MGHDRPIPLAAASSPRHDVYLGIVVLHALVAVAAFGAMALSGVYGSTARRLERPGAIDELRRYFAKPLRSEAAVLAVGPLGVAAVLADPHRPGLAHGWIIAALVLWFVASLLWLAVIHPAEIVIGRAVEPGDAVAVAAAGQHGRRLARAAAVTDVVFVVAFGLMVFQPG